MGFAKFLLVGLAAVASSSLMASGGKRLQADSPRDLIFEAMEKSRWLNFEGVVLRRFSTQDRGGMQVKISQRGGVSKTTALSPLPVQGVTTVDDGKTWSTFIPDENRIIIQDSPRRTVSGRTKGAAAANYEFVSGGNANIAGRRAFAIVAHPKFAEMPVRRYWLDAEYPLMLRMEIERDGKTHTLLDTRAISFVTVPEDAMKLTPAGDVRRIRLDSPERFRTAAQAMEVVGFKPSLPQSLPFGFFVNEPQVVGERNERFIALRLTDGLATATVYQWNAKDPSPVPCPDKTSVREANGLKMRLVGDLPEAVLGRILEAFVKEALKGLMPLLGTDSVAQALQSVEFVVEGRTGTCWIVVLDLESSR